MTIDWGSWRAGALRIAALSVGAYVAWRVLRARAAYHADYGRS